MPGYLLGSHRTTPAPRHEDTVLHQRPLTHQPYKPLDVRPEPRIRFARELSPFKKGGFLFHGIGITTALDSIVAFSSTDLDSSGSRHICAHSAWFRGSGFINETETARAASESSAKVSKDRLYTSLQMLRRHAR